MVSQLPTEPQIPIHWENRKKKPTEFEMTKNHSRSSDLIGRISRRNRRLCLVSSLWLLLLVLGSIYACGSVIRRANSLGRRCLPGVDGFSGDVKLKIAMVSFSEESRKGAGKRSFKGLMDTVKLNKIEYAEKKGYDFIDASDLVDKRRPASWSKIIAVRSHLQKYDWVFWNDADTLVTNSNISLESILRSVIGDDDFQNSPDLILTEDVTGVNAGIFFVRRSKWSVDFLNMWWNQTAFVRFGGSKSGDNDALKYLVNTMPAAEKQRHVRIPPMQCLFNSYPWFPTWKTSYRLIASPKIVWNGLDEKKKWAAKILQEINQA
eukprot:TRINITY_DN14088_c0_g1_i2.p1 TRINITY_DN14088_c0_g1~~TRINITY_DN14088_c0_g1_i2.p1  ORF type:complete len:333 (+),score=25.10 TRINITY_DN14088_c0_g1_i2:41-1000(+)